jgi:hypothetical protein
LPFPFVPAGSIVLIFSRSGGAKLPRTGIDAIINILAVYNIMLIYRTGPHGDGTHVNVARFLGRAT